MSWWQRLEGGLSQGDLISNCPIPTLTPKALDSLDPEKKNQQCSVRFDFALGIVLTQSCDLENNKTSNVLLASVGIVSELMAPPASYTTENLQKIRDGSRPAMHMLCGVNDPARGEECLVVDFRRLWTLPRSFVDKIATREEVMWRLQSPYVEHLSAAFGRFFARVALPIERPHFGPVAVMEVAAEPRRAD